MRINHIGRYLTLFSLCVAPLTADNTSLLERADSAFDAQDYGTAIELYSQALEGVSQSEKGEVLVQLALSHYRDQDDIAAFSTFLRAIGSTPVPQSAPIGEEEQQLCAEALETYLDPAQRNPREMAVVLRQQVAPQLAANPEYHYLGFFLAASYANLGMFDAFFEQFFKSYTAHPQSYMAQKTCGLLHMKLYERLADRQAREKQRELAMQCFESALEKNPADTGLMKMVISSADDSARSGKVQAVMTTILEQDISIPRRDVLFFIRSAVDAGQPQMGRQLLNRAQEWYGFSRSLNAAEKLLAQCEASS